MSKKKPSPDRLSPRRAPRQHRSKDTVAVIVDAARLIIQKVGYDQFSTTLVAEKAGVSVGTLYQYFPNKVSLIAALAETQGKIELVLVEKVMQENVGQPVEVILEGAVRAYVDFVSKNLPIYLFLTEAVFTMGRSKEIRQLEWQGIESVKQLLGSMGARFSSRDLELMAFLISYTVLNGIRFAVLAKPSYVKDKAFVDELVRMVVSYLR